jgi:hypothetical protein
MPQTNNRKKPKDEFKRSLAAIQEQEEAENSDNDNVEMKESSMIDTRNIEKRTQNLNLAM